MEKESKLKGAFDKLNKPPKAKPRQKSGKTGAQETYYLPFEIIEIVKKMSTEEKFNRHDTSVSKGTIITEAVKMLAKKLKYNIEDV